MTEDVDDTIDDVLQTSILLLADIVRYVPEEEQEQARAKLMSAFKKATEFWKAIGALRGG